MASFLGGWILPREIPPPRFKLGIYIFATITASNDANFRKYFVSEQNLDSIIPFRHCPT